MEGVHDRAGRAGEQAVRERFSASAMARDVAAILERNLSLAKVAS